MYEGLDPVTPDEVADCVMFALTRPLHVNLDEIVIKAIAQSSGSHVVRRTDLSPLQLRSPYDRQILRFAIPALGALAAEPLYVLVDTAVVGHLGRSQLAALGLAATVLSVLAMFNFLQYGTTAQVARATGAGEDLIAARLGAQCLWLSLAFGWRSRSPWSRSRRPVVDLFGAEGTTASYAVTYLRIAALGIPSAFLAIGGQGFLRGVSDLRTPLVIVIAGNVANVILEIVLVYGLDLGIKGSAWGTVIAQTGMGIAMAVAILRRVGRANAGLRPELARRLLSLGKFIFIRTASLIASFVLAGAVVDAARRRSARRAPDRLPAVDLPRSRARRDRDRRPDHRRAGARSGAPRRGRSPRACG